jgi:hypothetical protein
LVSWALSNAWLAAITASRLLSGAPDGVVAQAVSVSRNANSQARRIIFSHHFTIVLPPIEGGRLNGSSA